VPRRRRGRGKKPSGRSPPRCRWRVSRGRLSPRRRRARVRLAGVQLFVGGSYSSAVARYVPPPATRTRPFPSVVALMTARGAAMPSAQIADAAAFVLTMGPPFLASLNQASVGGKRYARLTRPLKDREQSSGPGAPHLAPELEQSTMKVTGSPPTERDARMERLWSRAVATGRNRSQMAGARKRPKQATTVARGCHRLPRERRGKEGVDGFGSVGGLKKPLQISGFCLGMRCLCWRQRSHRVARCR
jgi:hypothetical protein